MPDLFFLFPNVSILSDNQIMDRRTLLKTAPVLGAALVALPAYGSPRFDFRPKTDRPLPKLGPNASAYVWDEDRFVSKAFEEVRRGDFVIMTFGAEDPNPQVMQSFLWVMGDPTFGPYGPKRLDVWRVNAEICKNMDIDVSVYDYMRRWVGDQVVVPFDDPNLIECFRLMAANHPDDRPVNFGGALWRKINFNSRGKVPPVSGAGMGGFPVPGDDLTEG